MDYKQYVEKIINRSRTAQKHIENYGQEKIDELCAAIAFTCTRLTFMQRASEILVGESGMGVVENKVGKITNKVKGVYRDMKGKKSVGCIDVNEATGMWTYAKPMGVIAGIMPVTNGEATPICKALFAIKSRNSIILAPHPKAKETNDYVAATIRDVLKRYNAPQDLIIPIEGDYVNLGTYGELMKQADFILATGSSALVKAAYSSGTPAIGVGTGNVVSIIDGTTDLNKVADMIIISKSFDHATSCSTENSLIVLESCYEDFIKAMEKKGVHLIKNDTPHKEMMIKTLWPNSPGDNVLNRRIIAQSAEKIAEIAQVPVPQGTRVILIEEDGGYDRNYPLTGEKLSPVACIRKCKTFEEGLEMMEKILEYQGLGHSCGIHSSLDDRIHALANRIKVCKVCVNAPQSLTNSGSWTSGFPMSLTLGCGTWGGNSISHNATWRDLLNFTYLSKPIPSTMPTDEELFDGKEY
ncbi:MAG: aldehyde dehydrogenase family protein [Anaerovoracaceae bacterium]|jgi:sulfoacetaldehyde dehydrogenase